MAAVQAERTGNWLRIRLANPARRNALGSSDWDRLADLLAQAQSDDGIEVVSLSGEGTMFCAGVDRDMIDSSRTTPGAFAAQVERIAGIVHQFETLSALTIAALNGPAIGIGVHLTLAADFTLAVQDCFLWLPEASLGIPDVQHHHYLIQRLGKHRALEFIALGQKISAMEAHESGLIGGVSDDAAALSSALESLVAQLSKVDRLVRRGLKGATATGPSLGDPRAQARAVAFVGDARARTRTMTN